MKDPYMVMRSIESAYASFARSSYLARWIARASAWLLAMMARDLGGFWRCVLVAGEFKDLR